jgi:hypothetical protein
MKENSEEIVEDQTSEDLGYWGGVDEMLSQIKPKDIKELTDKVFEYLKEKASKEAEVQAAQKQLQVERDKQRAKLITQYQWIRAVLLVLSGAAVTFFGGLVAYLFGKEPK